MVPKTNKTAAHSTRIFESLPSITNGAIFSSGNVAAACYIGAKQPWTCRAYFVCPRENLSTCRSPVTTSLFSRASMQIYAKPMPPCPEMTTVNHGSLKKSHVWSREVARMVTLGRISSVGLFRFGHVQFAKPLIQKIHTGYIQAISKEERGQNKKNNNKKLSRKNTGPLLQGFFTRTLLLFRLSKMRQSKERAAKSKLLYDQISHVFTLTKKHSNPTRLWGIVQPAPRAITQIYACWKGSCQSAGQDRVFPGSCTTCNVPSSFLTRTK